MPEPWAVGLFLLFFGCITVCVIAATATWLVTARDLRHTLREARRAFHQTHALFARTNHVTRRLEQVILKTCDAATEALGHLSGWKRRAQAFFTERFGIGNGTREGPRRFHRG